jgi:murein DD-endopeptidase MepM/ murein hydrolase activator NlpD
VNLARYGSKYGYRKRDNAKKKQWHYGQDFPIGKGSKIYAVADGTIATQVSEDESHGFGNLVTIDHGNKIYSAYAHLQSWNLTYTVGQKVKAGEVIGWAGNTGPSTYHLHFEYRIGKNKEFEDTPNGEIRYAVDPMPYLQASMPTFWAKHVKNT